MSTESANTLVKMPKIGQVMESGTVLEWHCETGQMIARGDLLATIETDKTAIELEAPVSGRLYLHIEPGEEVEVGTLLAEIGDGPPRQIVDMEPPAPAPTESGRAATRTGRILASPRAKRLAAEHNIDLASVNATAADGVISEKDVQAILSGQSTAGSIATDEDEGVPLSGLQKAAARRLTRSWQTVPHIVQMIDVDATALRTEYEELKQRGQAVTLNDLLLHRIAQVLADNPHLNAVVENERIRKYADVNLGFAVDTPRGLLVPVIQRANLLSLEDFMAEVHRLAEKARLGAIGAEDAQPAALTVSNLGMYGIRMGTPVINEGESMLVFVGVMEERAVVRDGTITVLPQLTLSIAFDHRLADGVTAAKFSRDLRLKLENSGLE